jgi:hypothetical protein
MINEKKKSCLCISAIIRATAQNVSIMAKNRETKAVNVSFRMA